MSYFTSADYDALTATNSQASCHEVREKFLNLHFALRDKMRLQDWDLHPHSQKSQIVSHVTSATTAELDTTLTLAYFRPVEQAKVVESLMGLDHMSGATDIQPYRHPAIEVRLSPQQFVVELVVSPMAWWDQRNFIGKIELQRHQDALRHLLYRLDGDYRFGFWGGEELGDMHLTTWQLLHGRVLGEWMDTFADGQDWLRLGVWYEPENSRLSENHIVHELTTRIGELYNVYEFLLWTSNNNYHDFYHKRDKYGRRLYA